MTGCFHTFCQACLEKILPVNQTISCPECKQPTPLYDGGVGALPDDPAVSTVLQITGMNKTCCPIAASNMECDSRECNLDFVEAQSPLVVFC